MGVLEMTDRNSAGRRANEAEPLGEFTALGGKGAVERTAKRSQAKAGPDGGDAAAVGDTFKAKPKDR
jgi:hypothetical protein